MTRASDGKSADIGVRNAGGFADVPAHEAFCAKLDCVASLIFDQSSNGNHLGQRHKLVNASRHPITVGKNKTRVYGLWFEPGFGYHVDSVSPGDQMRVGCMLKSLSDIKTTGIATGNDPESIYAVMSGKQFNGRCCFDYGQ